MNIFFVFSDPVHNILFPCRITGITYNFFFFCQLYVFFTTCFKVIINIIINNIRHNCYIRYNTYIQVPVHRLVFANPFHLYNLKFLFKFNFSGHWIRKVCCFYSFNLNLKITFCIIAFFSLKQNILFKSDFCNLHK